jgi:hypothetical protein
MKLQLSQLWYSPVAVARVSCGFAAAARRARLKTAGDFLPLRRLDVAPQSGVLRKGSQCLEDPPIRRHA